MLEIHVSEHQLGMLVEGDYHDLEMLYKALEAIVSSGVLYNMRTSEVYLYEMMHEVRKAMNGEREFDVFQNQLSSEVLNDLQLKDDSNIYYGFYILHSNMIFNLLTLNLISNEIGVLYYHYIRMFIELVCEQYECRLPKEYSLVEYYHQYVELCTLRLLDADEEERMEIARQFVNDMLQFGDEYTTLVEEVNAYAKQNNCSPYEITYLPDLSELVY